MTAPAVLVVIASRATAASTGVTGLARVCARLRPLPGTVCAAMEGAAMATEAGSTPTSTKSRSISSVRKAVVSYANATGHSTDSPVSMT